MRYGIVWTKPAVIDLEAIRDFISEDSEFYAQQVIENILSQAETLADMPHRCPLVPVISGTDIRHLLVHSYRIIYQVSEDRIVILTVIHQRRQFP